ncbi:AAA family ATPase [Patescibacteria group bacterium]|nr:AAA family ATPase [Patescibacteria group bacterium]MCG2692842.1 AAA family ATPase [Candidatus Parcubacteria bacterium]
MEQSSSKPTFLICPACQGKGQLGIGPCLSCNGHGVYSWTAGRLLYWGKKINNRDIWQRRISDIINKVFSGVLLLIGLFGLFFLLQFFLKVRDYGFIFDSLFHEKHPELLVFWFSAWVDLYIYYRLAGKKEPGKRNVLTAQIAEKTAAPLSWEDANQFGNKLKIDISHSFNAEALKAIEKAWQMAEKLKHREVEPLHLLGASLGFSKTALIFGRLGIPLQSLKDRISQAFLSFFVDKGALIEPELSLRFKQILLQSYVVALEKRHRKVNLFDVLISCALLETPTYEVLYDLEINEDKLRNVVVWIETQEELAKKRKRFSFLAQLKPKGAMNRAMTAIATPMLDTLGQDLTLLARNGYLGACVARDKETEDIFSILETKNGGVLLIGNPGTGRTTIIEGIAQRMVTEEVPKILEDKRLVSLSLSALVAGASKTGSVEERVAAVISEVRRSGNIILFIGDIHNMIGIQTTQGELDISEILAQILKSQGVIVLATTTPADYRRYLEGTALDEALEKVQISEPKGNQAIQILEVKSGSIEYRQQIFFSYDSIAETIKFADRYIHDRYLPEKAITILEQAAVAVRKNRGKDGIVQKEDIAKIISERTNIPVTKITEKESVKLLHLEEKIHERMVDQEPAVKAAASALRRARAQLRDIKRPIANLLFLGPTGVGKTQLSKIVASVYFGSEKNMIRLDMSEYQEQTSIERLIGDVGTKTPGFLTEAVRQTPFSLLLLDEIEKAHPDILNVFLQVMDDGRLTDAFGRTIDFTNIILIATSNAGSQYIQDQMRAGSVYETIKRGLLEQELKTYFRPEFLNRFDDIIVFKPLSRTEIEQIASLLLAEVQVQMQTKGISLEVTPDAVKELAEAGFDPQFGARPLRRVIQERVSNALAKVILQGEVGRRDVVILGAGDKIEIKKAKRL